MRSLGRSFQIIFVLLGCIVACDLRAAFEDLTAQARAETYGRGAAHDQTLAPVAQQPGLGCLEIDWRDSRLPKGLALDLPFKSVAEPLFQKIGFKIDHFIVIMAGDKYRVDRESTVSAEVLGRLRSACELRVVVSRLWVGFDMRSFGWISCTVSQWVEGYLTLAPKGVHPVQLQFSSTIGAGPVIRLEDCRSGWSSTSERYLVEDGFGRYLGCMLENRNNPDEAKLCPSVLPRKQVPPR